MAGEKKEPSAVRAFAAKMNTFLGVDFPPGPNYIPWYYIINLQKAGTLPFCLALMMIYNNWSMSAVVYTIAHGSYGILWMMKHFIFRDNNWEKPTTFMGTLLTFAIVLGPYWMMPWAVISRTVPEASPLRLIIAAVVSIVGASVMMCSDCQKHFVLKRKRGLITDGFFSLVRHPNYLGEMMVYGGFALIVMHPYAWAHQLFIWTWVFGTNMHMKECSMSRYDEWDAYASCTTMLLPRIKAVLPPTPPAASKKDM